MSENCLFCKIHAGEIPSIRVYEDDIVIAFMDIMPAAKGHCLIVPKAHSVNLLDADPEVIAHVAKVSIPLANAVKLAVNADGIRIAQFNGEAAGQTVFHYHMHIIPAFAGHSAELHGRDKASTDELLATANAIKHHL